MVQEKYTHTHPLWACGVGGGELACMHPCMHACMLPPCGLWVPGVQVTPPPPCGLWVPGVGKDVAGKWGVALPLPGGQTPSPPVGWVGWVRSMHACMHACRDGCIHAWMLAWTQGKNMKPQATPCQGEKKRLKAEKIEKPIGNHRKLQETMGNH